MSPSNRKPVEGMVDCEGRQVSEGDIVEMLNWCYLSRVEWDAESQEAHYYPLYGVVKWNTEYFTYEPLVFTIDDFNGNCFAYVCAYSPPHFVLFEGANKVDYPATYFKVIGNVEDNPDMASKLKFTQMTGTRDVAE